MGQADNSPLNMTNNSFISNNFNTVDIKPRMNYSSFCVSNLPQHQQQNKLFVSYDTFKDVIKSVEKRLQQIEDRIDNNERMNKLDDQLTEINSSYTPKPSSVYMKNQNNHNGKDYNNNNKNKSANVSQHRKPMKYQKQLDLSKVQQDLQSNTALELEKFKLIQELEKKVQQLEKKLDKEMKQSFTDFEQDSRFNSFAQKLNTQFDKFLVMAKQKFDEFQNYKEKHINTYIESYQEQLNNIQKKLTLYSEEQKIIKNLTLENFKSLKNDMESAKDKVNEHELQIGTFKQVIFALEEDMITLLKTHKDQGVAIQNLKNLPADLSKIRQQHESIMKSQIDNNSKITVLEYQQNQISQIQDNISRFNINRVNSSLKKKGSQNSEDY